MKKIIHDCDHEINRKLGEFKTKRNILNVEDNQFIDCLTIKTWDVFYYYFRENRSLLDKNTLFNRKYLGERLLFSKEMFISDQLNFLHSLMRGVYELFFILNDPSQTPECVNIDVIEKIDHLTRDKNTVHSFLWIERVMPASMCRDIIQDSQFINVRDKITNGLEFIDNALKTHIDEINLCAGKSKSDLLDVIAKASEVNIEITDYERKLQEYKQEYNFVLLSKAFNNIRNTKKIEKLFAYIRFLIPVFVLVLIPIYLYITRIEHDVTQWRDVFIFLPLITLEVLAFYFMRLFYLEVKSVKSQILQIDIRLSLCEFIQDYVEKKRV